MIDTLSSQDVEAIKQLIQAEFPYVKKSRQKLESKINNPLFFLFRIKQENLLAGFAEFEMLEQKHKSLRLNGIAIKPKFRKQGLGKRLLKESLELLNAKGFETIWLLVKKENVIAKKMYEKNGFVWVRKFPEKIDGAIVEEFKLDFSASAQGVH